jgi:amidase
MPVGPDASEHMGGLVVEHVLSRSVRDSAAMLDATAGPDAPSRYRAPEVRGSFLPEVSLAPRRLRVALQKRPHLTMLGGAPLHPDCAAAAEDAAKLLAELGHEVEEAALPFDAEVFAREFFVLVAVEMAAAVAAVSAAVGRGPRRGELDRSTALTAMIGRQHGAVRYVVARERLSAMARDTLELFERYDVLLSPTLGQPPLRVGALEPRGFEGWLRDFVAATGLSFVMRIPGVVPASVKRVFDFVPYTPVANVTGQPSMSVPLFWNAAGVPIGTMFTGRPGEEATLLRLAGQLEQARPWRARRPVVHASAPDAAATASEASRAA